MLDNIYGIDLGTGSIKISSLSGKKYLNERNMIAIRDEIQVAAIGDEAFEMYEKQPANMEVGCPMVGGVIGNIDNTELLLAGLLKKLSKLPVKHSLFYIIVPTDITEVERRAFHAVVRGSVLRARKVKIVEKTMADAVYLGLDLNREKGSMIVNIGAETVELAVLCGQRIIVSKKLPIGGKTLDSDIVTLVRRRYNLHIGMRTAEALKLELAYMCRGASRYKTIYGVNTVAGLPRQAEISSAAVNEAITENIDTIIDQIKSSFERTPPEIMQDILDGGIYMTGGTSKIPNLPYYVELETGMKVQIAQNPIESTILGLQMIMQNKELHHLTYSLNNMRAIR